MARVNCDPYAGGHLFALVNRVTCLLNSEEEVMATVRALEQDGVATDDIDIFKGEQGARCLDLSGREHGRAVRLLRTLEHAMGEEREAHHRIDDALRRGEILLCVRVHNIDVPTFLRALVGPLPNLPSPALETEHGHQVVSRGTTLAGVLNRKSEEKARALRVLKALHAHEIHYWGPWAFEDLHSSSS